MTNKSGLNPKCGEVWKCRYRGWVKLLREADNDDLEKYRRLVDQPDEGNFIAVMMDAGSLKPFTPGIHSFDEVIVHRDDIYMGYREEVAS